MEMYYKKDSYYEKCAYFIDIVIIVLLQRHIFRIGGLDI